MNADGNPLVELLAAGASKYGGAIALQSPSGPKISYSELWSQCAATASQLRALGIGPRDTVAIALPNGVDAAMAFLAVGCACAAAPLNPAFKVEDFRFYLEDLKAKALLTADGVIPAASQAARELQIPVIRLDSKNRGIEWDAPLPTDPALFLHTSGTTSRPKLVPLSAANLTASAANIAATLALSPADRCLNIMPLFHIHGIGACLLATLHSGGTVICSDGVFANRFFEWLATEQPTWYSAVPTMHQAIVALAQAQPERARAAGLRFIRSSSAALPPQVAMDLEAAFGSPVLEAYGMTEASHQMASNPLPPRARKFGSVGLAAGPEVAIMDAAGQLLPAGEVGEIVIRGTNVTAGYWNHPEANAQAFTNGWFRTGDQGRLDEENYLYLTGRLKELINRGGEKVSPREIDEVLLRHPSVKQALAFAIPHAQLGEEIGAAVELQAGTSAEENVLRMWCAESLPYFKVPRLICIVDAIPKGPTGKLQRIGLATKLGVGAIDDSRLGEFNPPNSELEQRIAAIWQRLLPEARCGRTDRFEALGGDSLLAARMLTELGVQEGVEVPYVAFVKEGTIAALAAAIEASSGVRQGLFQPLTTHTAPNHLYCFPGHDGRLLGLVRMAQELPEAYAASALDLNQLAPGESVEQIAKRCVEELWRKHGAGHYYLAGVCFGGCVALEVAQQLTERGGTVGALALIDTLNPAWAGCARKSEVFAAWVRQWTIKLRYHFERALGMSPLAAWQYLRSRVAAHSANEAEMSNPFRQAMRTYRPQLWVSRVLLVRLPGRRIDAPELGWSGILSGDVRIVDLPFELDSSLSGESASRVARVVGDHLQNAR